MTDPDDDLRAALKLESLKFTEWSRETSRETNDKVQAAMRSLAAKGLSISGQRVNAELEIHFGTLEALIERLISLRAELALSVPALLSQASLEALRIKLEQRIEACASGVVTRAETPSIPGPVGSALRPRAEQRAYAMKMLVKDRLIALPLEMKFGTHPSNGGHMKTTLNITNSNVGNLNFGNVRGDLTSSIQKIESNGHGDLAREFRAMSEAVMASPELKNEDRKEILEHLSAVSEEMAKPPEKRKTGPLKSSLSAIKTALTVVAELFTIYQGLEHALNAAGVVLPMP